MAAANDKKTSWEPVKHYDFLPLLLKQELWISWTCAILSYSAKLTNFQLLLRFLTFYAFDSDNTTLSLHFKKQLGIYVLLNQVYWNLTNFALGIIQYPKTKFYPILTPHPPRVNKNGHLGKYYLPSVKYVTHWIVKRCPKLTPTG